MSNPYESCESALGDLANTDWLALASHPVLVNGTFWCKSSSDEYHVRRVGGRQILAPDEPSTTGSDDRYGDNEHRWNSVDRLRSNALETTMVGT
jgi:hypothetical protein